MKNRHDWVTRLGHLTDPEPLLGAAHQDPGANLGIVWQLTLDNWAFAKESHAESGLQRHVARFIRGKS